MQYKGVSIQEEQHGNHVRLAAEMSRELDEDELDMLQSSGTCQATDGTIKRTVEAVAYDRQQAALEIEGHIDKLRELGYR